MKTYQKGSMFVNQKLKLGVWTKVKSYRNQLLDCAHLSNPCHIREKCIRLLKSKIEEKLKGPNGKSRLLQWQIRVNKPVAYYSGDL
jgi:hypothetical protein